MFVSKKLVTETCAAAEVYSVGPVDGALHQEMIQNCGGMWTIAQNKSVCVRVCVREREGELEKRENRTRKMESVYVSGCVCYKKKKKEGVEREKCTLPDVTE